MWFIVAFVLALIVFLLYRLFHSMQEVQRLNVTLEQRLAAQETELKQAFERLRLSEHQHLLDTERRRMMRDMHDGLGSQLVQTLNLVRNARGDFNPQRVTAMLQQALEELRLMLDSMEPMDGDLPTILGTLRLRIGHSLDAAGIELEWAVEETQPIRDLDSRAIMHLFRCLQEIFANVIKHARADKVRVSTWDGADGDVHLSIEDNGIGNHAVLVQSGQGGRLVGRGLSNIQTRAHHLGAQVRFYAAQPGFGVELRFRSQHASGAENA